MTYAPMQLRAFVAVIETGTVTEAALRLGRTQPQTGRLIAGLEQACGLELFRRSKRRLTPTEQGASFYEEVVRILNGLDDLTRVASTLKRNRSEHLRVLTMPNLAQTLVPSCIQRLRSRFPNVFVSVDIATRNLFGAVVGLRPFDIAVAILPPVDLPGMSSTSLGSISSRLIVPRALPLSRKKVVLLREIAQAPLVATSRSTALRLLLDDLCARSDLHLNLVAEAPNMFAAARMAEAGIGCALVDELTARHVDNRAVAVAGWKPGLSMNVGTIEPAGRSNQLARCFSVECRAILTSPI